MAEPKIEEASRLMLRMNSAGTVRRLGILHDALRTAYRVGVADTERRMQDQEAS